MDKYSPGLSQELPIPDELDTLEVDMDVPGTNSRLFFKETHTPGKQHQLDEHGDGQVGAE